MQSGSQPDLRRPFYASLAGEVPGRFFVRNGNF